MSILSSNGFSSRCNRDAALSASVCDRSATGVISED